jgi:hypothetical protein
MAALYLVAQMVIEVDLENDRLNEEDSEKLKNVIKK